MKIALYLPSWPPGLVANGIVTYGGVMVPELRRKGHEVYILTPRPTVSDDPFTIDLRKYVPANNLRYRALWRLSQARALFETSCAALATAVTQLVRETGVEVCEIEETSGNGIGIMRLNLLPVVLRMHGPWVTIKKFYPETGLNSDFNRTSQEGAAIRKADFVTAPSANVLDFVSTRYRVSLPKSRVIFNPVRAVPDADAWSLSDCQKSSMLFVGHFDLHKGGDLVVRAFAELAPSMPDVTLTFVGPDQGIPGAGGARVSLSQFIQEAVPEAHRSRIRYLGQLRAEEITPLRRQHYLTLIASRYESFGYAGAEAMAWGCPLVATNVGGLPEIISHRRSGLLAPPEDAGGLASACRVLLEDPALASRLGHQAREDCLKFCAPELLAEQTLEVYAEAIGRFRHRRSLAYSQA